MTTNRKRTPAGVTEGGQFATEPKAETDVALAAPGARPDPHGGFRLTKVRTARGREGLAFFATLTENGRPVADVIQEGYGGQTTLRWHGKWRTEATERFEAFAETLDAEFEPQEEALSRLLMADEVSRKRNLVFLTEQDTDEMFWSEGMYREVAGLPREHALALLAKERDKGRVTSPRVWDKATADFITLDEALAKP